MYCFIIWIVTLRPTYVGHSWSIIGVQLFLINSNKSWCPVINAFFMPSSIIYGLFICSVADITIG